VLSGQQRLDFKKESSVKLLVERLSTTPRELSSEGDAGWWGGVVREAVGGEPTRAGGGAIDQRAPKIGGYI
jgi:hypothetical protein